MLDLSPLRSALALTCALGIALCSSPASAAPKAGSKAAPKAESSAAEPGESGEAYDLKYKFEPGEVLRWQVVHRAAVDSTIKGTNQTAETRSISVKVWKISEASAERIKFVHSVESIDMWQKTQGRQEVRYNSQTDENPPPGYEDVAKAVGVPLSEVTIDARGNILERKDANPQSTVNTAPIALPLPAKPVPVGHVWTVPLDIEVILHGGVSKKIPTRQQFTLEKVADGLATIQVDTQVLAPLSDPAIEAQLVQRMTNGTLKFDIDRGRVVGQQMDADRRSRRFQRGGEQHALSDAIHRRAAADRLRRHSAGQSRLCRPQLCRRQLCSQGRIAHVAQAARSPLSIRRAAR